jgi:hypothetical protein
MKVFENYKEGDNLLVAKFMELTIGKDELGYFQHQNNIIDFIPEYHNSWDLLMPAWRRLREIFRDVIENGNSETVSFLYDEILSAIGTADIQYAYPKIIKGIEWANENK